MDESILKRISVSYFEGSHYWEVTIDGKQVHTTQTKREADLFVAELILRFDGANNKYE